ncbi:MAG: type IV pili twitching motility protein PilT, partial [bacterium]
MDYKLELEDMLTTVIREGGSDLHLSEGRHPTIRVSGVLLPLVRKPILTKEDTFGLAQQLLTKINLDLFVATKEIDFSYNHTTGDRFRGNGYYQQGSMSFALRLVQRKIRTFEELNLPPVL